MRDIRTTQHGELFDRTQTDLRFVTAMSRSGSAEAFLADLMQACIYFQLSHDRPAGEKLRSCLLQLEKLNLRTYEHGAFIWLISLWAQDLGDRRSSFPEGKEHSGQLCPRHVPSELWEWLEDAEPRLRDIRERLERDPRSGKAPTEADNPLIVKD